MNPSGEQLLYRIESWENAVLSNPKGHSGVIVGIGIYNGRHKGNLSGTDKFVAWRGEGQIGDEYKNRNKPLGIAGGLEQRRWRG